MGTGLDRKLAQPRRIMPGDEDARWAGAARQQSAEQLKTRDSGQTKIEHQAVAFPRLVETVRQQGFGRFVGRDDTTRRLQHARHCLAHAGVVLDHNDTHVATGHAIQPLQLATRTTDDPRLSANRIAGMG